MNPMSGDVVNYLGLAVLGVIAVLIAVVVLATRDRAAKRALVILASLAAMAVAGFALLANISRTRSGAATLVQQQEVAQRVALLEAQAGAGGKASTTKHVTIVEGPAVEALTVEADGKTSSTSRVRIVGGPAGRPDLPADVWVNRATILAALVVMILLAYVFIDAGRRGRYTWPLRVGSAAVFALLCVLMGKLGPLM
jgi:4-amino-4-deoxy-L-arabinose transferase-like glycosyltransferase